MSVKCGLREAIDYHQLKHFLGSFLINYVAECQCVVKMLITRHFFLY